MAKSGKIGFKESAAEYDRLRGEIGAKRFAPMYLLMGEESYFIDALGDMLAENILGPAERDFSQIVLYGKDADSGAVVNLCRQTPMMGSRQVVIVKEAQQLGRLEQLSLYTQKPSPTTVLVLCHKGKSVDKRMPLYKQMRERGEVFESVRPRDYEIGPWLGEFIKRRGYAIQHKAIGMLVDHLGAEISRISNELTKLITCLPQDIREITADHIEQNIGVSKEYNNFELTKALSEKNIGRVMRIADNFARNPKDNPLVVTLSTVFGHFQRIFILNYQRWLAKHRGTQMPPDMELSGMLKLPNPFFLNEYKQAAGLYPNKKVFVILDLIREYDLRSKGMGGGSTDEGELLKELLLKILML
ncbi:MAG: DNA polymerase III subunit delta [Rikenellaceae bacterium]|jgi:DNA polymerase-3 subunit delta|nr:DNA polymerase III subunit delta [Rikenellaceae bacterium]